LNESKLESRTGPLLPHLLQLLLFRGMTLPPAEKKGKTMKTRGKEEEGEEEGRRGRKRRERGRRSRYRGRGRFKLKLSLCHRQPSFHSRLSKGNTARDGPSKMRISSLRKHWKATAQGCFDSLHLH